MNAQVSKPGALPTPTVVPGRIGQVGLERLQQHRDTVISQGGFKQSRRRRTKSGNAEQRQSRMGAGEDLDDLQAIEIGEHQVD